VFIPPLRKLADDPASVALSVRELSREDKRKLNEVESLMLIISLTT
jgi:hypothetical protein